MAGAILFVTVPETIITSAYTRKTKSAINSYVARGIIPRRSKLKRALEAYTMGETPCWQNKRHTSIISIAQQARPKVKGKTEPERQ